MPYLLTTEYQGEKWYAAKESKNLRNWSYTKDISKALVLLDINLANFIKFPHEQIEKVNLP